MYFNKNDLINTKKLLILSFIMAIIGLVIIMRVLELSIPNKSKKITNIKEDIINESNERGLLSDRNGNIIASNIYVYNLKAYPRKIKNPEKIIKLLKDNIGFSDFDAVKKKIYNRNKFEVIVKKNITAPEAKRINSLGIPGLEFVPVIKRFYPNKKMTAHYIGHVNKEMKGVSGAERSFNDLLNKGENIKLSIDIRVQYAVRDELIKASSKFNSKSATAIIADINNGEIISLVSLPDYNPNNSIDPKNNSYRNTATLNLYEMGSTLKIFSIAAALERSDININSKFDARSPIKISKFTIKDYHPQNRILSTKEIFLKSSNIGVSRIAKELGNKKLKKFYDELGLLKLSKIDLHEKTKPMIPKKWGEIETATLSYGHGLSISPMQMIEAGSLVFSESKNDSVTIKKRALGYKNEKNNFISAKTKNILKDLMLENITYGTGKGAKIEGYEIGGKTATGEKNSNGRYERDKLVSSFLAIFPVKQPKYISLVLFDEPFLDNIRANNRGATGGITAAPTTAKILKRIFPLLGIPKKILKDPDIIVKQKDKLNLASY